MCLKYVRKSYTSIEKQNKTPQTPLLSGSIPLKHKFPEGDGHFVRHHCTQWLYCACCIITGNACK